MDLKQIPYVYKIYQSQFLKYKIYARTTKLY